jgi:hypothetical protein
MNISENNYSVATLKEKFLRAGRGKENTATPVVGKKAVVDEVEEKKSAAKQEEEEEPLLVENKKRFVLFPIKYHEVMTYSTCTNKDLANVQESRSVVLDS